MAYFGTERSRYSGGPLAADRAWRAFCHHLGHWVMRGYGSFAVTLKGGADAIGLVGPYHPIDWPEPEIGWALWNPAHEGKGLAFEAATASLDFVFRALRWRTAVSYIDPTNLRSVALARRLGATPRPRRGAPAPRRSGVPPPQSAGCRGMITLTGAPVLHTTRLTLRVPALRDWEAFAGFLTSDRAIHVGGPVTRERAWRSLATLSATGCCAATACSRWR